MSTGPRRPEPRRAAPRGATARRPRRPDALAGALYLIGLGPPLLALLLVLVSVRTPPILSSGAGFAVPPQFDAAQAVADATTLARLAPDRSPGSPTAPLATEAVAGWLGRATGVQVAVDRFTAASPDGPVALTNLVAVVPGESTDAIILIAHRDDRAPGPGANDNASGTAALVELARTFSPLNRTKTLVLASVDGGTIGQAGARRLAARPPPGVRPVAAIALDGIASSRPLPVLFAGSGFRRSGAALPRAAIQALETYGLEAALPGVPTQLLDLVQPGVASGAQAPFVDRGLSAVQIGDGRDATGAERLERPRFEAAGLALVTLVQRLDGAPELAGASDAYLMLGERALPAWVLAVLAASLLVAPALVAAGGMASARRAGALQDVAVRVGLVAMPLVAAAAAARTSASAGLLPDAPWRPAAELEIELAGLALVALGAGGGALAAWRLRPRRPGRHDVPAAMAATLATAAGGGILILVGNPPTVLLLVPALHAWALLPLLQGAGPGLRLAVLLGPGALTVGAFLAARGAGPTRWIAAVAAREVPGVVCVGLALALASVVVALPAAAGRQAGGDQPSGT